MELSPRLSFSYLAPAQAQKHVTVNETFRRLDQLVQLTVLSRTTTAEPGSPSDGDAYLIPASATGTNWSAYSENSVAAYQDGAWVEIDAVEGLRAYVVDEGALIVYNGSGWATVSGGSSETSAIYGVNTTADAINRLAVKSDAILLSHDDVTPGAGDMQIKCNKASSSNTASFLFQDNYSGRAEYGLTGDDDFHIKVSPDNFSTSYEAVVIDKDTGDIALAQKVVIGASAVSSPAGQFHSASNGNAGSYQFICEETDAPTDSKIWAFQAQSSGFNIAVMNDALTGSNSFLQMKRSGTAFVSFGIDETKLFVNSTGDVALGSSSPGARLDVQGGGVIVGSPTGGDKGAGTINAEAVYDDNALLSCYVFDQALDGAIDIAKWDALVPDRMIREQTAKDPETGEETVLSPARIKQRRHDPARKFTARIDTAYDPLTLDGYAKHWREKRHLTSLPNETDYDPEKSSLSAGEWIQRLVETVEIQAVLIEKLNQRTKDVMQA